MNKQTNERVSNTEWHNVVLRTKLLKFVKNIYPKEIKYILRVELRLENGKMIKEMIGIQLR